MIISVIGTGYVGLVTGAVFADFGHTVYCVDIDAKKIESLKNAEIPFYEPGLKELVQRNVDQGRLHFTTNYAEAIPHSKTVFICVGTPPKDNGEADLKYLFAASEETAKHLSEYTLIVIKSTVPIGVETQLQEIISQHTTAPFEFASCPEFLKEGSAVTDAIQPDRIVLGVQTDIARQLLLDVFKNFPGERLICDLRSAQMVKYASNTLLATKISFANAIAVLSEKLNTNAEVVLAGVGLDPRIGPQFLKPGVGYGGSCFPKDISAFIKIAENVGYDFELLKAVEKINAGQGTLFLKKVEDQLETLQGKTIALLGLAFKPNTDDIREAPSLKIIKALLAKGATVRAYDPLAEENTKKVFADISYCNSAYEAAKGADALLIVTDWNEFKELDLKKIKEGMKQPLIIDGRNIYNPQEIRTLGFTYLSTGRP